MEEAAMTPTFRSVFPYLLVIIIDFYTPAFNQGHWFGDDHAFDHPAFYLLCVICILWYPSFLSSVIRLHSGNIVPSITFYLL